MHDPPLYSFMLHFWQRAGISEFWMRSLSLMFSVTAIAGMMSMGKGSFGLVAGVTAGLLVTFSAADIRYAQEVGQYAMFVCILTLFFAVQRKLVKENDWGWWGLWGGIALVGMYTHYGVPIVIAAAAGSLLVYNIYRRRWTAVRRQLAAGLLLALLILPLILFVIPGQVTRLDRPTNPIALIPLLNTTQDIILFHLMGNQLDGWPWPNIAKWVLVLPMLAAIGAAIWQRRRLVDWPAQLVIAWLTYYLVSRLGIYFFNGTRHSLLLSPLIFVTAAGGIAVMVRWRRWLGILVGLALLSISIAAPVEPGEQLRPVTQAWLAERQPGELTYVYYGAVPGVQYQLARSVREDTVEASAWIPACYSQPLCVSPDLVYGRWARLLSPPEKREAMLAEIGFMPERLWLLFSHVHAEEDLDLLQQLSPDYEALLVQQDDNAAAYLLLLR